ncbi:histidinol-phosphatase HisJ family protein [Pseudoflavonifractor phocaeensis]|uniref:histidinol-phosphatase HisJ family protein n=1 Tax=Pseudoflavonifractor phocaeensis TaxID=1870988 RepID=UPI00195D990F|nr:histidinol-phosphatase HisJ family protein [Pseudoflavonifractor phocaeensis]MBM6723154.1 histidinol-phosphatase HisJ family protein [Pseudoflavonifractor phocaeensis]
MYCSDYHTHSQLSPDSSAPLEQIAQAAVEAGLDELCVTDHCDLLTLQGEPVERYDWPPAVAQYQAAAAQFSSGLTLKLGLELGMGHLNPAAAQTIVGQPELDFVLGSVHNQSPEKGGVDFYYVPYPDSAACYAALDDYFASMAILAATPCYDVLTHIIYPLRYMEAPVSLEGYYDRIRAILRTAVENGRGMEVNTYRGRTVAEWKPILELYRDCGGEILTVGSDAHIPGGVGKGIREAMELIAGCSFRYVCTYDKRKPVFHKL